MGNIKRSDELKEQLFKKLDNLMNGDIKTCDELMICKWRCSRLCKELKQTVWEEYLSNMDPNYQFHIKDILGE